MLFGKLTAAINELASQVAQLRAAVIMLVAALPKEGKPEEPTEPEQPTEPEAPYVWDRNTPRASWATKIDGIPVGYVRVSWEKPDPLVIDDPVEGVIPSTVPSRGKPGNTNSQRIIPAAGLVIMVRKDGTQYGTKGLEHIQGAGNPAFGCRPFLLNGGVLGFWVMWEQYVGGHYIAEDPDREKPLFVKASNVVEFV